MLPDGRYAYWFIDQLRAEGIYDQGNPYDPLNYYGMPDRELVYLAGHRLSPVVQHLYERFFPWLRAHGITCLLFETGRSQAYRALVEREPVLVSLQTEWRNYIRAQARGCIGFIDEQTMRPLYAPADFIDAVHVVHGTADRISARLSDELENLERSCSQTTTLGKVATPKP